MGGHIRGGLKAQHWGTGGVLWFGGPVSCSVGDTGLPKSFWVSFSRVETLKSGSPWSLCDPGGAQAENPQTGIASL